MNVPIDKTVLINNNPVRGVTGQHAEENSNSITYGHPGTTRKIMQVFVFVRSAQQCLRTYCLPADLFVTLIAKQIPGLQEETDVCLHGHPGLERDELVGRLAGELGERSVREEELHGMQVC